MRLLGGGLGGVSGDKGEGGGRDEFLGSWTMGMGMDTWRGNLGFELGIEYGCERYLEADWRYA